MHRVLDDAVTINILVTVTIKDLSHSQQIKTQMMFYAFFFYQQFSTIIKERQKKPPHPNNYK